MADSDAKIIFDITTNDKELNEGLTQSQKKAEKATEETSKKVKKKSKEVGDQIPKDQEKASEKTEKDWDKKSEHIGKKLTKAFSSAAKEISTGALRQIGAGLVQLGAKAAEALVGMAKMGIEYNAQMEQYTVALKTALGSEEEAQKVMNQIKQDAASTPFDVDGLTQANMLLISAGESAENSRDVIMALGDAVSATGGGSDELSRMAQNLQQVKNAGKATAMDIKQFAAAGVNIYGILSDYTGKTTEEVQNMDVSYEVLTEALKNASSEGGAYFNAMADQSQTFNGQLSTLKDNATAFVGELTEGLFDVAKSDALPTLNGYMEELQGAFEAGGFEGLAGSLGDVLSEMVDDIAEVLPDIVDMGVDIIQNLIEGLNKNAGHLAEASMDIIASLATGLLECMPSLLEAIPDIIAGLVNGLISNAPKIVEAGFNLLNALGKSIPQVVTSLFSAVKLIGTSIVDNFTTFVPKLAKTGENLLGGIVAGFFQALAGVLESVVEIGKSIIGQFKKVLKIQSPSKVMRDEVGKNIVLGISEGMEKNSQTVLDSAEELGNKLIAKEKDISAKITKLEEDAEKKKAEISKLSNKTEKEKQEKALEERVKTLKASLNEELELVKKFNEEYSEKLDELKKKHEEALKDIEDNQDKLADKIKGYGDLFETLKVEDDEGNSEEVFKLTDLDDQIEAMRKYGELLEKLKDRGASSSLMDEILGMDMDDAMNYMTELNKKSDSAFDEYMSKWEEKQKLADDISSQYYKEQIDELQDATTEEMKGFYSEYEEVGKYLTQGIAAGIENGEESVISAVRAMMKNSVGTAQEELDIHSPSRIMRDLVGKNISLGVAEGISENDEKPKNAISTMTYKLINAVKFPTMPSISYATAPNVSQSSSMYDMLTDFSNSGNKDIVLNSNLYLDGEKIYKNQQKTQYKRGYNFDMGAFWR